MRPPLADIAQRNDLPVPEIEIDFLNHLAARNWPGNVRELRNEAERFVLGLSNALAAENPSGDSLADRVGAYEKALISASIAANGGRIKETYESLGLSRRSLYDKMQRYGLNRDNFASED